MEFYLQSLSQEKRVLICRALEDEILGRRRLKNDGGENYDFHGRLVVPEAGGADTEEEGEQVDGFVFKILCLVFYSSVTTTLTTREQRREAPSDHASRSPAQNKDCYSSAGRGRGGKEAPEQLHRDEKQPKDGQQQHGHTDVVDLATDSASFSLNFLWNWEVLAKVVKALAKEDCQENQKKSASNKNVVNKKQTALRSDNSPSRRNKLPSVRETLRELFLHDFFHSALPAREADECDEVEMMADDDHAMEVDPIPKDKDRSRAAKSKNNSVTKINTAPLFLLALEKEIEHAATTGPQMRQSSSCGAAPSGGPGRAPRICSSNLPPARGRQKQNSKSLHLLPNGNMNSNHVQHLASEDEQEELSESSSSSSRTTQQDSQSSNQRNKDQQQKFQRGRAATRGSSRGENEEGTTTKAALSRSKAASARPEHVLTCLEYYISEFICCGSGAGPGRSSSSSLGGFASSKSNAINPSSLRKTETAAAAHQQLQEDPNKMICIDLDRLEQVLRVLFGKEHVFGPARTGGELCGASTRTENKAVPGGAPSSILAIRDHDQMNVELPVLEGNKQEDRGQLPGGHANSSTATPTTKMSQFQLELILGMLSFQLQVKRATIRSSSTGEQRNIRDNCGATEIVLDNLNFYDFLLTEMKFPLREFFEKLFDDYYQQEGIEQLRLLRRHEDHEDGDDYDLHPHAGHPNILPDRTSRADGARGRTRNRDEIQILPQGLQIAHICRAFLKQKKTAVRMLGLELLYPVQKYRSRSRIAVLHYKSLF